jgi:hypothetical protein
MYTLAAAIEINNYFKIVIALIIVLSHLHLAEPKPPAPPPLLRVGT